VATLEERVTALEGIVRNNELAERERYNEVRREIADLGALTAKSFLGVHHQMDRMESRLGGVETRLTTVEGRLERIETTMSTMDTRFGALEADMSAVLAILHQRYGGPN
jgi:hypothetical protein